MTHTDESPLESTPRPELTEDDYNAPFLHETTSLKHVLLVLFTLVFTCALVVIAIMIA